MTDIMDPDDFERVLGFTGSGEDGRLARRYIAKHVTEQREKLAIAEMAFVIAEQRTADAQALCEQARERVKELEWIIETLKTTAQGFRELDEGNFVTLQELEQTLNPRHEGE